MIVTGIGTRKTDKQAFAMLYKIARRMAHQGWELRSGGAIGADTAWERGWDGFDATQIFLSRGTSPVIAKNTACGRISDYGDIWLEAEDIASRIHPRWENLDEISQALHTRNVFQILGLDLQSKTDVWQLMPRLLGIVLKVVRQLRSIWRVPRISQPLTYGLLMVNDNFLRSY